MIKVPKPRPGSCWRCRGTNFTELSSSFSTRLRISSAEYECLRCGWVTEVQWDTYRPEAGDAPVLHCPHCSGVVSG